MFDALARATPARLFLRRAGTGLATRDHLEFQTAHAEARDAVGEPLEPSALLDALSARSLDGVVVRSEADDLRAYLTRPDLGRRLHPGARERLVELERSLARSVAGGAARVAIAVCDGLSARAVERHAPPLLAEAVPSLLALGVSLCPIVVVCRGRVAIGDEIGELLGATLSIVLIGERPGLSASDSLGLYLTHRPRVGRTDAERNCISNVRLGGMSYAEAARRLAFLAGASLERQCSGVALKDETPEAHRPLFEGGESAPAGGR